MTFDLLILGLGATLFSFISTAFATGGVYFLLISATFVLPISAVVPLMSTFDFASLLSRLYYFKDHIQYSFVAPFALGSVVGVGVGIHIFVSLSETLILISLSILLLTLIWTPILAFLSRSSHGILRYSVLGIGIAHAFFSSLFGIGVFLQPSMIKTNLAKLQITATLAGCLLAIESIKIIGFVAEGFDYLHYTNYIIIATLGGILGSYLGKKTTHKISDRVFQMAFKGIITLSAVWLFVKGIGAY